MLETYETGRGSVRVRAALVEEDTGRGTWQIVVTEMPYQVKKADLVEQLAELIESKKRRCSATCATRAPRTCAWSSSPRAATSSPKC